MEVDPGGCPMPPELKRWSVWSACREWAYAAHPKVGNTDTRGGGCSTCACVAHPMIDAAGTGGALHGRYAAHLTEGTAVPQSSRHLTGRVASRRSSCACASGPRLMSTHAGFVVVARAHPSMRGFSVRILSLPCVCVWGPPERKSCVLRLWDAVVRRASALFSASTPTSGLRGVGRWTLG